MSARKRKATDSMEQACMLCLRAEADPDVCGPKLEKQGVCAHVFCLYFANELFQQRVKEVGLVGFLPEDIQRTIARAAQKDCFVCGDSGATITCREMGCDRSFHLPCAVEGGCITQFFGLYRSFCWEHRPEQAVEAAPEETTTCLICLDPVGDRKSFGTMVCPACKHAWFHRGCIQVHASHAGFYGFCCPHCQNEYRFLMEMLTMGIQIPKRGLSWEDNGAYEQLYERHRRCDASECLCPAGRERAEEEGPWQLLLCCSCAAEGTHKRCSYLRNSTASWECDGCAGLGTASSASLVLNGPTTSSQSPPWHLRPAAPPLVARWHWGTPTAAQCLRAAAAPATLGPSGRETIPDCNVGPKLPRRPRRHCNSSHTPAPSDESCTSSQAAVGLPHGLLAPETSSPTTGSQAAPGPSRGSPELRAAAAPASLGPTACETIPDCNGGPKLPTASLDAAAGPAVHRPQVLALIHTPPPAQQRELAKKSHVLYGRVTRGLEMAIIRKDFPSVGDQQVPFYCKKENSFGYRATAEQLCGSWRRARRLSQRLTVTKAQRKSRGVAVQI
ncbi:PHD finger protein 7-like [Phalacrocorax carbo]|uniref:PHD finger protein 7-like n=1 Tax=Phalacrocorax carbo TaxID=9209 RepID=UPI00311A917E